MIIAIDGPAGSGKSTVARKLADKLNISYLDTGAMYRGITLMALEKKVDFNNSAELEKSAYETKIGFERENSTDYLILNGSRYLANGMLISDAIRSIEVTRNSRSVADNQTIRKLLVEQQQKIAQQAGALVTEGRDQATVVFPDAEFKFYLDARAEIRAKRRFEQMLAKGEKDLSYEQILSDQISRDNADKSRSEGALKVAEDALVVDSSEMDIEQVVNHLLNIVRCGQGN